MPRTSRASVGDIAYHVINRGNRRGTVFLDAQDYSEFVKLLDLAAARLKMRLLGYCLMPNHFHLLLMPYRNGDLSLWMQWLMTSHVRRHHKRHETDGHVWQGRFKAFPVANDNHFLTVLRYIERNPLRAGLVSVAEDWKWSSLREHAGIIPRKAGRLSRPPVPLGKEWAAVVNEIEADKDLERLRKSVNRGTPFGDAEWATRTAEALGLESSLKPRGRPPRPSAATEEK